MFPRNCRIPNTGFEIEVIPLHFEFDQDVVSGI